VTLSAQRIVYWFRQPPLLGNDTGVLGAIALAQEMTHSVGS